MTEPIATAPVAVTVMIACALPHAAHHTWRKGQRIARPALELVGNCAPSARSH
jgi:hypothetical protein